MTEKPDAIQNDEFHSVGIFIQSVSIVLYFGIYWGCCDKDIIMGVSEIVCNQKSTTV